MPTVLDTKCSNIHREERSVADAVAFEVLGSYQAGVWDFVMPPLLIINLLKHRRKKESFILNLLFTKNMALEAARDMAGQDIPREKALQKAEEATAKVLAADTRGIYAEKVRQKQLKEIDLLAAHYHGLIMTEGKAYDEMVTAAYPDRQGYLDFLRRLNQAEKEVNHAALGTVGRNEASVSFIERMEKALEKVRRMDADKYFPV